MPITGRAWKYGANIDIDLIIAGRYCNLIDADERGGLLPYVEERLAQRHADLVANAASEQKS